jgi:hypothetical protein
MTDEEYTRQAIQLVESIRKEFGFGFGDGHQPEDMFRVIKARNDIFNKLTAEESYEIGQRPEKPIVALAAGRMSLNAYRAAIDRFNRATDAEIDEAVRAIAKDTGGGE